MRKLIILAIIMAATPALAGRGSSNAAIEDAIASGNADNIIAELERAERLVCAGCIAPVMELLDNDDGRVREAAAWWFARRPAYKAAISLMSITRLQGTDSTLARNAADALGTFRHPDAIPALSVAVGRMDLSPEARTAAVTALGTIADPSAEPVIRGAFGDPDATTRAAAVDAWNELRGVRPGDALVPLLGDSDANVRARAAAVLGEHPVASAMPMLESILASDADPIARRNAAWALMKLGDPAARPVLQQAATSDSTSYVRSFAAGALKQMP
jgi:HEAT repeat protein